MPFMEWTNDFTVGVDEIDNDHKKLISLINELSDAVEAGKGHEVLENTLDGLILYISYHFNREEGLYIQAHYPDYANHKKGHDKLTAQVMDIQAKFHAGNDDTLAKDVLEFLKNWLYDHIMLNDRKFGLYLHSSGKKV